MTNLAAGRQAAIAIMAVISVRLAGLAVFWIYRAAYGWPVTRVIAHNDDLRDWYVSREAAPRSGWVSEKRHAIGGWSARGLVVTVGLPWFAPQAAPMGHSYKPH